MSWKLKQWASSLSHTDFFRQSKSVGAEKDEAAESWLYTRKFYRVSDVQVDVVCLEVRYQLPALVTHTLTWFISPYSVRVIQISISIFLCCPCFFCTISQSKFSPQMKHHSPPTPRSHLIEIEMLFPSFSGKHVPQRSGPSDLPRVLSHLSVLTFLISLTLICLPSNLLSVNRPPT